MIFLTKLFIFLAVTFNLVLSQTKEDNERPYEFGFTIDGQHRQEKKDSKGIIQGEFGFITADGIYHVTVYATDENGDFKILSMKNLRVSAPLDGSPGPDGPLAPTPTRPPLADQTWGQLRPEIPQNSPQNDQPASPILTTPRSKAPYAFTTQPTIKPACGGCGYVTTPKPIPGQRFPFQTPAFQNPGSSFNQNNGNNAPVPPTQNNNPTLSNPGGNPGFTNPGSGSPGVNPGVVNPGVGSPGGNPGFGNPGGNPGFGNPGGNPGFGNPGGNPGFGKPGGNPGFGNSGSNPGFGNPGGNPGFANPGGNPGSGGNPGNDLSPPSGFNQVSNPGFNQGPNPLQRPQSPPAVSALPPIEVTNNEIQVQGERPQTIPIKDKFPGMTDGLPNGIQEGDIKDILYKFHYTVGFHGHYEKGLKNGGKIGGYFVNGRDGISRIVTYVADENGYRPKFKFVRLGLDSDETPKEGSEKTFGLKSFEFVWYPID